VTVGGGAPASPIKVVLMRDIQIDNVVTDLGRLSKVVSQVVWLAIMKALRHGRSGRSDDDPVAP